MQMTNRLIGNFFQIFIAFFVNQIYFSLQMWRMGNVNCPPNIKVTNRQTIDFVSKSGLSWASRAL